MAVAFNDFDTLLAPFIKQDKLTYAQVKQSIQNWIFSINSNSRAGAEPAFSNVTFDLTPPEDMLDEYAIIGGEMVSFTYGSCQQEMDMLNKAFFECMLEGDAEGKLFSYPIPTYNIHPRFDWDNPNNKLLWAMAGKYGTPYFANFLNGNMDIKDVRSMCCRLRLDLSELRRRNGGLFGSGDSTGSIGVVTINLPRLAYEHKEDEVTFFEALDKYLDIAKDSLEIKRNWLQEWVMDKGLIPAYIEYVGTLDNHFSTIGIVGMNEMCENFMGANILDENAKAFALRVSDHIRNKLLQFQDETGHLYNYEATPAESTCVSGNTLVQTLEGSIPIKELVGREDVYVYCYDTGTNKLRIKKAYDIRKTGMNQKVVKVTFDNGQYEILTPNHQVYTRTHHMTGRGKNRKAWWTYEWVSAGFLREGQSIVSNYQYHDGYHGFGKDYIRNSCNNKLNHRFVYEELVEEIPDGYVIHHIDGNKNHDSPENLKLMTEFEHKSLHAIQDNPMYAYDGSGTNNFFYGKHHTKESIDKISLSKMGRLVTIEDILPLNKMGMPYEDIAETLGVSRDTVKRRMRGTGVWDSHTPNHKVVSVEWLDEPMDVYNMEVEDCENYFIGGENGLLVHNCYRLALADKKKYPDIITQGEGEDCYYTNSCHIPVKLITGIDTTFAHQDALQTQFTGGTVIHCYLEGAISGDQAKAIVKGMFEKYSVPYMSLSPISRYCPTHGYVEELVDECPYCGQRLKKYQRITGYLRCVDNFNRGKAAEFADRAQIPVGIQL